MSVNPGIALDHEFLGGLHVDDERLAGAAHAYSGPSPDATGEPSEVESLRIAIRCLDLTRLRTRDPVRGMRALCEQACAPLTGVSSVPEDRQITVASVCVFPEAVATAVGLLRDSTVPVAAACGFPDGAVPADRLASEIRGARAAGAQEIDAVIDRGLILGEEWAGLYDQVRMLRAASRGCLLKVIVRSGTLPTGTHVARASLVSAMAGADFIKTSTGMDPTNATLEAGIAIAAAIRAYRAKTGLRVGLKPAGGLRAAADALVWLRLARGELDTDWIHPALFRLGASSLLAAVRDRWASLGTG